MMKASSIPGSSGEHQSLVDELRRLRSEASGLMVLGYQLRESIDVALAKVDPAAPHGSKLREAALSYMATTTNRQLRQDLVQARGPQSAASLRTKLNADLEARRGRRHPSNGKGVVHNGNGAAFAVAAE